eukprot:CAMPEP_0171092960 /NCGR_PEP_ID=MMETSP0766_2-20121228/38365_1 /TAXON_ID=439317 /ORGANISM="Gambierdiscus australes, Strain CAWD 149" /LENGTH=179 /DNA_ID=CAMNT_0011551313 /DNA_START=66 /DNA_END=603 /DNA_ORIENTATION=-
MESKAEKVQCFGRKKTAVAVALVRTGSGQVRMNGCPIHTIKPDILRIKVYEPLLLLGRERCSKVDIKLRVQGGGHTAQIYALRQAVAKGIVAYYQKYIDEASKKEIKDILMALTGPSSLQTPGAVSRRSLVAARPVRVSRSPTAEAVGGSMPLQGWGCRVVVAITMPIWKRGSGSESVE